MPPLCDPEFLFGWHDRGRDHRIMQLCDLPDALIEACLTHAISEFRDAITAALVCRAWQQICTADDLWRELACSRIQIVAAMALKGHVPAGRWIDVARDHVATLDWSEPARQYQICGIGSKGVTKHKTTTALSDYVFHVVLMYESLELGAWTGTFDSVQQINSIDDVVSGEVSAEILASAVVRLWTRESSPWNRPESSMLRDVLPLDADDPEEEWKKLQLHVSAGLQYRTQKLYRGGLTDAHDFHVCKVLGLPARRSTRASSAASGRTRGPIDEDQYCMGPRLMVARQSDGTDDDDGDAGDGWIYDKELHVALDIFCYLRESEVSPYNIDMDIYPASEQEVLTVLELRLLEGISN